MNYSENEIATIVVNACFEIHSALGPGLFESVYEEILVYEIQKTGLNIERQAYLPITWKDLHCDNAFKADVIIENKVILELKAIERIEKIHQKQLSTYLKLTGMKLCLLINFNVPLIKDGIQRIVNNV